MTTWTLILFFHVGMMGNDNANATTTVPGFTSENTCIVAGRKAKSLETGTKKMLYTCVKVE